MTAHTYREAPEDLYRGGGYVTGIESEYTLADVCGYVWVRVVRDDSAGRVPTSPVWVESVNPYTGETYAREEMTAGHLRRVVDGGVRVSGLDPLTVRVGDLHVPVWVPEGVEMLWAILEDAAR